jgi:hypothetical protein
MAPLESPLGVENGLIQPTPGAHPPEGLHSQDPGPRRSGGTHEDPKCYPSRPLAHERIPLSHFDPYTLLTPQPQVRDTAPKTQEVIVATRPNLSDVESRELEELLTECGDICAMDSNDCGQTDRVYHPINTGESLSIRQPPRRLPLEKQAEVG